MKLIVGLGNPGPEYAKTRHNAGFMAVERLAQRFQITGPPRSKFNGATREGNIAGEKCVLLQPLTYMNRSGLAVGEAVTFYKLDPKPPACAVMILVDDLALPSGRIRLRSSGGPGGHNGLIDIARALGGNDFPRLRIGIDAPGRVPQVDYVLQRFSPDQLLKLDVALDRTVDAVECWIKNGIDKTMSLFNSDGSDPA
jgi:PTH1 family peptidyl-tRNA hydrolase